MFNNPTREERQRAEKLREITEGAQRMAEDLRTAHNSIVEQMRAVGFSEDLSQEVAGAVIVDWVTCH